MVKFNKKMNDIYFIAEVGLNHNGKLKEALEHVKLAKKSGCNAVKFQTYITEKRIKDPNSKLRPLLKKLELSYNDFAEIKKFSDDIGIEFFSTAFDKEAVDFLSSIGVDLFKVASFDTSNQDLFDSLLGIANRIIFSTGMTDMNVIKSIVNKIENKVKALGILHCVSSYPTPNQEARMTNITTLKDNFPNCIVGYSDHTTGILAPSLSVSLGARIIEKHFKLSEDYECIDSPVSISPDVMNKMINQAKEAYEMMGEQFFGVSKIEQEATQFKRSNLK